MEDCLVKIVVKNQKLSIQAENANLVEMAILSGYFQTFIGTESVKRGMDLDTVKENLLDVYLAASQQLDEMFRKD